MKQRRATYRIVKQLWWVSAAANNAGVDMEVRGREITGERKRVCDINLT